MYPNNIDSVFALRAQRTLIYRAYIVMYAKEEKEKERKKIDNKNVINNLNKTFAA